MKNAIRVKKHKREGRQNKSLFYKGAVVSAFLLSSAPSLVLANPAGSDFYPKPVNPDFFYNTDNDKVQYKYKGSGIPVHYPYLNFILLPKKPAVALLTGQLKADEAQTAENGAPSSQDRFIEYENTLISEGVKKTDEAEAFIRSMTEDLNKAQAYCEANCQEASYNAAELIARERNFITLDKENKIITEEDVVAFVQVENFSGWRKAASLHFLYLAGQLEQAALKAKAAIQALAETQRLAFQAYMPQARDYQFTANEFVYNAKDGSSSSSSISAQNANAAGGAGETQSDNDSLSLQEHEGALMTTGIAKTAEMQALIRSVQTELKNMRTSCEKSCPNISRNAETLISAERGLIVSDRERKAREDNAITKKEAAAFVWVERNAWKRRYGALALFSLAKRLQGAADKAKAASRALAETQHLAAQANMPKAYENQF